MDSISCVCKLKWCLSLLVVVCIFLVYVANRFKTPSLEPRFTEAGANKQEISNNNISLLINHLTLPKKTISLGSIDGKIYHNDVRPFSPLSFNPRGNDTLLFIHIQKTGGTEFLRHLLTVKKHGKYLCVLPEKLKNSIRVNNKVLKHVRSNRQAKILIQCPRDPSRPKGEQWLFSERTMKWVCGLHASYTEFKNCLPHLNTARFNKNRRLHFMIMLRHPVLRYVSEYFHVQRNATWAVKRMCGGKPVTEKDMPPCYPGFYEKKPWPNLTLSGFVACESNWANNRQVMMLADLDQVHCFNKSALTKAEREEKLLESAKRNLEKFSFFGLTEYMSESCTIFEKMFGVKFPLLPHPRNLSILHSGPILVKLWNNTRIFNAILERNHLDVKLYEFAFELFIQRANSVGISIHKNLIEQELQAMRTNPQLSEKAIAKYKKLRYNIS